MALAAGTRIGPYEVVAQIGVGGMGEVYRATDVNLKRQVAIKVLPASVAADAERLARFQREAEVLAALNHPNIAQIYGLEKSDGTMALIMELVEGPTLADCIMQGAIPIGAALPIAKQIAEALESAHERAIVHRDLKPANIKVRSDGTVKVLDFGLAKAMESSGGPAVDISQSPTMVSPATSLPGMILGTPAYMSPEQARGGSLDHRADIWAFGCVVYEMLTGRRPFAGETFSDTIARVLEREPDWRQLPNATPTRLQALLRQCLQKDEHQRLRNIADARNEIEAIHHGRSGSRQIVKALTLAGAVALMLALLAGAWWSRGSTSPSVRREPVSVVISDVQNRTNDPAFNRTLEPLLRLVLEGASFVTAYDRARMSGSLGIRPPDSFDETAAREMAVKQGLGVVLSGSLESSGGGYKMTVRAIQAVTGAVIATAEGRASDKDGVVSEATRLVTVIRRALGADESDSGQLFANASLSASSLSVVRYYAQAQEAAANSRFEESRQNALRAVELDPKFGVGWQLLAVASRNLGQLQDAERYIKEALRHLDGMNERERFTTRGMFYRLTGDYQQCVREYGQLIDRYVGDVVARNQIALCASKLRDLRRAQEEMRQVVDLLPDRSVFRVNLALYANYAGDFRTGEQQAQRVRQPDLGALLALAFSQVAQERLPEAIKTYEELAKAGTLGASFAASGLGDIATFEGRYSDAIRLLEQGAADDLRSKSPDRAAAKFGALAFTHLSQGRSSAAIASANAALANSNEVKIRFLAARTLIEADRLAESQTLIAGLASETSPEPRAYAKILEAQSVFKGRQESVRAIQLLSDANALLDTWIGHFDLGRTYLEAGMFTQADSEFDRCIRRRGEALSLFLDEEPTFGYFPSVHYYQGRSREGLNDDGFAASYRTYLGIRGDSSEDQFAREVRSRVGR